MFVSLHFKHWTLNSESFASTCLSISEYGTIVTLHATISYWLCNVVEYSCLVDLFISNEIKIEFLRVETTLKINSPLINLHTFCSSLRRLLFFIVERSNSNTHLYIVLLILLIFKQTIHSRCVPILSIGRITRTS